MTAQVRSPGGTVACTGASPRPALPSPPATRRPAERRRPGCVGYSRGRSELQVPSVHSELLGASVPAHSMCSTQSFANQRLLMGEHTSNPSAANRVNTVKAGTPKGRRSSPAGYRGPQPSHLEEASSSKTACPFTEKCRSRCDRHRELGLTPLRLLGLSYMCKCFS